MLKGKFIVLSLCAAALLCLQVAGVSTVNSGIVSQCFSTASSSATYPVDADDVQLGCPKGDVPEGLSFDHDPTALVDIMTIDVTIKDNTNAAMVGVPATDIWTKGCNDALVLCGGSGSLNAAAATNASGMTTITGDPAMGGCDTGLNVVCQGVVIGGGACPVICLGIAVRTPDFTSAGAGPPDLRVDIHDFSNIVKGFVAKYQSPPKPYEACYDIAAPFGSTTLPDFAKFGQHYNHVC